MLRKGFVTWMQTSEAQDPTVGGVSSGAMPEAPMQPREPPNQKPPGVNIEVTMTAKPAC